MANYKNGIDSRNKILASAKKVFYENGFKKTTIAMIAEDARVPVGLVSYYFKKEELLTDIHEDYINIILRTIIEQVGEHLDNSLQMHLLMLQIHHAGIYKDERNLRLYKHMIDNSMLSQEVVNSVDSYLVKCVDELNIDIEPEAYAGLLVAQFGAHRELMKVYLPDYDPQTCRALLNFTGTIAMRLAQVDQSVIDENIKKASRLLDMVDTSAIRFLA